MSCAMAWGRWSAKALRPMTVVWRWHPAGIARAYSDFRSSPHGRTRDVHLALTFARSAAKPLLNTSMAYSFWAWSRGRAVSFTWSSFCNARPTLVSSSAAPSSSQSHGIRSISRQRTTPWISGIGPLPTISAGVPLIVNEPGPGAGSFVIQQRVRASGVEPDRPAPHDLQTHPPIRAAVVRRPPP